MTIIDLLHEAIRRKASDLHLAVGFPPAFRIDGRIVMIKGKPLTSKAVEDMVRGVLDERRWKAFQDP
jgi:Tfp pilus assembly pilus retraction ATPase PilT